jgi:hypothetical protein
MVRPVPASIRLDSEFSNIRHWYLATKDRYDFFRSFYSDTLALFSHASAAGAFSDIAVPAQRAMWGHNETAYNTRPWPTGLPTKPLVMQGDDRDGPNSHMV